MPSYVLAAPCTAQHNTYLLIAMKELCLLTVVSERPTFRSFDIEDPSVIPQYKRNLPHLRLEGATYFVTFRLADSIPRKLIESWNQEREDWLDAYGLAPSLKKLNPQLWEDKYFAIPLEFRRAFELQQQRRFLIELDNCHGSCLLEKNHKVVAQALNHFHGKRVWLGDYVDMPNHVHVLVQPFPEVTLEGWLYSVKRFASTIVAKNDLTDLKESKEGWKLWQSESFDRIVRDREELLRTRKYIANNPVKLRLGTYSLKQMGWLDEFAPFIIK